MEVDDVFNTSEPLVSLNILKKIACFRVKFNANQIGKIKYKNQMRKLIYLSVYKDTTQMDV